MSDATLPNASTPPPAPREFDSLVLSQIASLIQYQMSDIAWDYTLLTEAEKLVVQSQDNLDDIRAWVRQNNG